MEFRNLKLQYEVCKEKIDENINKVLLSGNFIQGDFVKELEAKLASYVGVKHCISCANGTDALTLVMETWGIKEGDAVFVPTFTFFASAETVSYLKATPVFVDVSKDTFNIDLDSLELAINNVIKEGKLKPKAIIAVDLFGQVADYVNIQKIAEKYNLKVLEDGAQALGGMYESKKSCSFGDAATTSFFPAKPLGCYGDGGAIFTNDDKQAALLRSLCVHGKGKFKYDNVRIGVNSRLDEIQAAVLLGKFDQFVDYELDSVNRIAAMYTKVLQDVVKTPVINKGYYSSWAQYCILLESENERNELAERLEKEYNIPTIIYYPKSMHQQTAYENHVNYVAFLNAEEITKKVLALPIDPYKTDEEIEYIITAVKNILS